MGVIVIGRGPVSSVFTSGLKIEYPVLWFEGDLRNPEMLNPEYLQLNAYGVASILKLSAACKADQVKAYASVNDRVELWSRVGGIKRCLFRGRVIGFGYNIEGNREDRGSVVCIDDSHVVDDKTISWNPGRLITPAYAIQALFDGYYKYVYPYMAQRQVFESKIDSAICELGDDLAVLDREYIEIAFSGENIVQALARIFQAMQAQYIWWFEPN